MKKGFTLAETVLGVLLLGMLLVVIGGVFVKGLSASRKSERKVTNVILAGGMMDNIMLMRYSDVPVIDPVDPTKVNSYDGTLPRSPDTNLDGTVFPPIPYPIETDSSGSKKNYYYQIEVKPYGTSGRIKRVTVTVLSKGVGGESDTKVTLESLKVQ